MGLDKDKFLVELEGMINPRNRDNLIEELREHVINPFGVDALPFPAKTPEIGDKVILLDMAFELIGGGAEVARLARLPYVTIKSFGKLMLSDDDGGYFYTYEIYINESIYIIGLHGYCWKYLNESDNKL